jgi:hypothetical protein
VSSAVAARHDVGSLGESFAGRRMSGQLVEAPLVRLPRVAVGDWAVDGHVAVNVDLGAAFDGILGPSYFGDRVVTTDVVAGTFTVHDPGEEVSGLEIPIDVHEDGLSHDPFVELVLPSGRTVLVEVDTGSDRLILDSRLMAECGIAVDDPRVTARTGVDETGHSYVRYDTTLAGAVHLASAPETTQEAPRAMFQELIHDGLVGTDFLYRYRFSLDLAGARLVLGPRGSAR